MPAKRISLTIYLTAEELRQLNKARNIVMAKRDGDPFSRNLLGRRAIAGYCQNIIRLATEAKKLK